MRCGSEHSRVRSHGEWPIERSGRRDAGESRVVTRARADGKPNEVFEDLTTEHGCDLVAVGTHGRADQQPYVLGSVTARVLQHSPVDVLVVPTRDERYRRIDGRNARIDPGDCDALSTAGSTVRRRTPGTAPA